MKENIYSAIQIDDKGIFELAGGGQYVGEKKDNVKKVVLKNEIQSKRPKITIAFAVVFCIIGLFGFSAFFFWIQEGGMFKLDGTLGLLVFLFIGLWLFWSATVPKTILTLYTNSKTTHKLIFRDSKDKDEAKNFVIKQCEAFGYEYEVMY